MLTLKDFNKAVTLWLTLWADALIWIVASVESCPTVTGTPSYIYYYLTDGFNVKGDLTRFRPGNPRHDNAGGLEALSMVANT